MSPGHLRSCCVKVCLFGIMLLLSAALPGWGADTFDADLFEGGGGAQVCTDPGAFTKRCLVSNLGMMKGLAFDVDVPELTPGVYRLVLQGKLPRINNINTAPVTWNVHVSGVAKADFTFNVLAFTRGGTYQELSFPVIVTRAGTAQVELSWSRETRMRAEADAPAPEMEMRLSMDDDDDDLGDEMELALEPPLASIKYLYLAIDRVAFVPVSDLLIETLSPDKIRYAPGESATVTLALRNFASRARALTVQTDLVQDLDAVSPVDERTVTLTPSGSTTFTVKTPAMEKKWGYAVRCRVLEDGQEITQKSEYFTVHDNMWAVVITGKPGAQFTGHVTVPQARASAKWNKNNYCNWIEYYFWAPDEFGDFTPDEEYWWSGQGEYFGSVSGTKAMISEGHKVGISFAVYSNLWGGDGPPAYEMARRQPDWARPGKFAVDWFDRWHRNSSGQNSKRASMHVWPYTIILSGQTGAFVHHGNELVAANRMLGWDAVRYDSHAICDGHAHSMGIVKKTVRAELPNFQFGYNSSTPLGDEKLYPAFQSECEGGGLVMEEAIRSYGVGNKTYKEFAERILVMKNETRRYGGHFLAIGMDKCYQNDFIYQYIFWLAGNTHPCYYWTNPPSGNYMQFATRFAGQLWDLSVTDLPNPETWIDVGDAKEYLWLWQRYVHQRDLGGGRRQCILHLINSPTETVLYKNDDLKVPEPHEDIPISLRLPAGAKVRNVWFLTAEPTLTQEALNYETQGERVSFVVPRLRFWSVVVVDLENAEAFE